MKEDVLNYIQSGQAEIDKREQTAKPKLAQIASSAPVNHKIAPLVGIKDTDM